MLLDTVTSNILWQTAIGKKTVTAIAFSPDGKQIAASSDSDHAVRILNAKGGKVCQAQPAHGQMVTDLVFTEGGKALVSTSQDGTMRIRDPATCRELRPSITAKYGSFRMLALHPDGRTVAVAAREAPNGSIGGVEFWDVQSGQMVAKPLKGYGGTYGIGGLAFSAEGDSLMVADSSGMLALVDWKQGKALARGVAAHDAVMVWRTVFSPKGDLVATSGKDRVLGIWSAHVTPGASSPLALSLPTEYTLDGAQPVFSGNGQVVAYIKGKHVIVRESASGKVLLDAEVDKEVYQVALSPDGRWLAVYNRQIHLWHLPTRQPVEWDYFGTDAMAFSADGTRLAVGAFNKVYLIDCVAGKEIAHYQIGTNPHNPRVLNLAFDPAHRLLLATTEDGDVYRLDAHTLQHAGDPWQGLGRNGALAFSADGRRLAVARVLSHGNSTQVVVLDSASGAQLAGPLEENLGWGPALAFTPDGNHLLMAGGNGTLSLWDTASGQRLARIGAGSSPNSLRGARLTRDLRHFYSCDSQSFTAAKTRCDRWEVSLKIPAALPARTAQAPQVTLAPVGTAAHLDIVSLSNAIDMGSSKLTVRPGRDLLLFLNAGATRLLGTKGSGGSAGQPTMVYADSMLNSDASLVTVPLNDGQLAVFNFRTGKMLNLLELQGACAFLSSGALALDRGTQGMQIVDPRSGRELRTLSYPPQSNVSVLAAGRKLPAMVAGTTDGTLLFGRTDPPARPFKVLKNVHRGAVISIVFSPDEKLFASGGADGQIQLFDTQTGNTVGAAWTAHNKAVTAMAFNADGSLLGSGSTDGTIRVSDVMIGQPVSNSLVAHTDPVLGIVFTPTDGRLLSFGSDDNNLRIWTLSNGPKRDK